MNIRASAASIPGLALARSMRAAKARASGSSAWLGADTSITAPWPQ